jgi:hypothetical protein
MACSYMRHHSTSMAGGDRPRSHCSLQRGANALRPGLDFVGPIAPVAAEAEHHAQEHRFQRVQVAARLGIAGFVPESGAAIGVAEAGVNEPFVEPAGQRQGDG